MTIFRGGNDWDDLEVVNNAGSTVKTSLGDIAATFKLSSTMAYPLTVSYSNGGVLDERTTVISAEAPKIYYNPSDLKALATLDPELTPESEGVVWNKNGRLVELTYANEGKTSIKLTSCSKLTKLDVSDCESLTTLDCSGNELTSLNVSGCGSLTTLNCSDNELTKMDVSGCTILIELNCSDNDLTKLDVSGCESLGKLYCYDNDLSQLDVSMCENLGELDCSENKLTKLILNDDIKDKDCEGLIWLDCHANKLASLDVSECESLKTLYCYDNALKSLDVSELMFLEELNCNGNKLTSLDVSYLPHLSTVRCCDNKLTSINLLESPELVLLECSNNALKSLDLSNAVNLEQLHCSFETSAVVLHHDANVEFYMTPTTEWNAFSIIDAGDNETGPTDVDSETAINVSPDYAYPVTIEYLMNNKFVGTTIVSVVPEAPTGITTAFDVNKRVATVSWTDNSDAETGFVVQYLADDNNWKSVYVGPNTTTATLKDLQYETTYPVRVAATNDAGFSPFEKSSFETPTGVPNLRVVGFNEKTGLLDVSWVAVGEGCEYLITETTNGGGNWTEVASIKSTEPTESGEPEEPTESKETSAVVPMAESDGSLVLRIEAIKDGHSLGFAYAPIWNLADYSDYKAFALTLSNDGELVLNGVKEDGSYGDEELEKCEYDFNNEIYICVLGQKSKQEEFTITSEIASRCGIIDFIDSGTNNTITVDGTAGDDVIVIGTEIVETTEEFAVKNPYDKLLEYYADQYGEHSPIYLRLKAQFDKAYKSLSKKVKTIKTTWGTISIEGGADVRFVGAKTVTVNAGDGNDAVHVDSLGFSYVVSGGEGDDTLDFSNATGAAKIDLGSTKAQSVIAKDKGKLALTDAFEKVIGTVYGDTITGSSRGTNVTGNGGSDKITLVGGNNVVKATGESQTITVKGEGTYDITLDKATKSTIKASGVKERSFITVTAVGDKISFTGGSGAIDVTIKGNDAVVKNSGAACAKVAVTGNNAKITTGKGADDVYVKGDSATISVGDGDDTVKIDHCEKYKATLGKGDNELTVNGVIIVPKTGGSGAILDDDVEFAGLWFDGIDALSGLTAPGQLLTAQPVKLDGAQENDRKELDKLYASLNENWDVVNELDPTLDLLESQLEPEN